MLKLLLFALYLGRSLCSEISADLPVGCDLQCRSARLIDNFIDKLSDESIEVSEGVKFVKTNENVQEDGGRSVRDSFLTRFKRFLSSYELQVKIPDLLPRKQEISSALHSAIGYLNDLQSDGESEGTSRKGGGGGLGGGKKGGGAILMMATMMGGTMAALGFGALGMLAMKALTVSAMALLLSAVIGLKKLLSKGDDEGGHSVSYIPVHHGGHRKRRDLNDLPYRAHVNKRRKA